MAATEAEIANIALARIGVRRLIDSLEEASPDARTVKALFATARDAVLEELDWPFARRRKVLAAYADREHPDWAYVYGVPTDMVAPRRIITSIRNAPAAGQIPFDVEDDETVGRVLLCDEPAAELVYTARITAVPRLPPLFQDALAWYLAADLALALAVKPQVGLAMRRGYDTALSRAIASSLRSRHEDQPPDSQFVNARE